MLLTKILCSCLVFIFVFLHRKGKRSVKQIPTYPLLNRKGLGGDSPLKFAQGVGQYLYILANPHLIPAFARPGVGGAIH